jgi:hypothetical protein
MTGDVVFTEKRCSRCDRLNWDSETGSYNETCTAKGYQGKPCNIDGRVHKWDAEGNEVP